MLNTVGTDQQALYDVIYNKDKQSMNTDSNC